MDYPEINDPGAEKEKKFPKLIGILISWELTGFGSRTGIPQGKENRGNKFWGGKK